MPIDFSTITSGPDAEPDGGSTLVSWTAGDPDGQLFQLYENRVLAWHGTARHVTLPAPIGRVIYQVGTVGPDEGGVDFSADLPPLQGTGDKAKFSWIGGTWEEPSPPGSGLAGFYVYGEATPGGGVNFDLILGSVSAYLPGLETDGYGYGGFGEGGFGAASARYWWTSEPLANGTWTFAVVAFDNAGNLSSIQTAIVVIANPPAPPARDPATGLRLSLTYDTGTNEETLTWGASPG